MRTTLRIDDDIMGELGARALREKTSVSTLVNQLLRAAIAPPPQDHPPYREKTFSMGPPRVNLNKALKVAAALENNEILRKLAAHK